VCSWQLNSTRVFWNFLALDCLQQFSPIYETHSFIWVMYSKKLATQNLRSSTAKAKARTQIRLVSPASTCRGSASPRQRRRPPRPPALRSVAPTPEERRSRWRRHASRRGLHRRALRANELRQPRGAEREAWGWGCPRRQLLTTAASPSPPAGRTSSASPSPRSRLRLRLPRGRPLSSELRRQIRRVTLLVGWNPNCIHTNSSLLSMRN
jgi:hypothetical protein